MFSKSINLRSSVLYYQSQKNNGAAFYIIKVNKPIEQRFILSKSINLRSRFYMINVNKPKKAEF